MVAGSRSRDWRWLMLVIAATVVGLDRWSKLWVVHAVLPGRTITVVPQVFWISHVLNTGAAFSLFEGANSPLLVRDALIGFSLLAAVVIVVLLWRMGRQVSLTAVSLALILGGAVGNLYDRWRLGYVIDFLRVKIVHYYWPDFNLADSAIVVGACLLLLEMLRPQRDSG